MVAVRYFRDLWTGALPLSRVLWVDMLAVGTLVNIIILLVLIVLVAADETFAALAVFLLHIPYSIVLFAAVWRSAEREKVDWAWFARTVAAVWLAAVLIV